MPIPLSGPLGFSRINQELGCAAPYATPNSSINSPSYRTLAGIPAPASQIALSCFYGKSPATLTVEYLVVGGGGGGGTSVGGGGGAGGVRSNINAPFAPSDSVNPAAWVFPYIPGAGFAISIGGGGGGAPQTPTAGGAGFGTCSTITQNFAPGCVIRSTGGGCGGSSPPRPCRRGGTGGSGGGGGGQTNTLPNVGAAGAVDSQGATYAVNVGGSGTPGSVSISGGGGGGAAGAGATGASPPAAAPLAAGGPGVCWRSLRAVGGGGAGASGPSNPNTRAGSFGGGGSSGGGPATTVAGGPATPNTGGGGGAGKGGGAGGSGGSGVIIIGYPGPQIATGGTVTTSGPMVYHTFTGAGTFQWN